MKKNTLENFTQSKKKLMLKKLKDNLKWAKQKEEESIFGSLVQKISYYINSLQEEQLT